MNTRPDVAVVGLGYVGLTLAVTMAQVGYRVWGYERQHSVVDRLKRGDPHIFEPGLAKALREQIGRNLFVEAHLPEIAPKAIIICVSTPVGSDNTPDLRNLRASAESVSKHIESDTLVIVRSTVPVGTTRNIVLPALQAKHEKVRLAFCPERTIQGKALQELRHLPQVVGGLDEDSKHAATSLWKLVTDQVVTVGSLEAAEMVKLVNNSHTDLLYAFGNEVAMMASQFGIDPSDVIHAANFEYPRPDIARPGFVAGPCLTKDPYLLVNSFRESDYTPRLVSDARHANENLPYSVAQHFLGTLKEVNGKLEGESVLVCGFAYKGWPATDDVRGSPAGPIVEVLLHSNLRVLGHDYLVSEDIIRTIGAIPVHDLEHGLSGSKAVLFVNEHPDYRNLNIAEVARSLKQPSLIYDCWRMFDNHVVDSIPGVKYAGIGFG